MMQNVKSKTNTQHDNLIRLVQAAMLAALSIIMMIVIRFPLFPTAAPWLEYDMGDVPVIIATLILGPGYGLAVLLVTCVIQAFTVSAATGVWGLIMHFIASGAFVLLTGIFFKRIPTTKGLVIGLLCGAAAMTALMIPLNIVITPLYTGAPTKAVIDMLLPIILPFNAIKSVIHIAVSVLLYIPLDKALTKMNLKVK